VSFLLDTDTCSAFLKKNAAVFSRFVQYGGRLHLSVISYAELVAWVRRPGASPRRALGLSDLLLQTSIITVDASVAEKFGEIRAQEIASGRLTPDLDLLIASTALVHGLTLVTHNVQDYANVPGLPVADWLSP
jgi:tRNA(fMet)-specific endonuclease VapC